MTPSQLRTFENNKYRAMILVPLGHAEFALCGPDRQPIAHGDLLSLLAPIYAYEMPTGATVRPGRTEATEALMKLEL